MGIAKKKGILNSFLEAYTKYYGKVLENLGGHKLYKGEPRGHEKVSSVFSEKLFWKIP